LQQKQKWESNGDNSLLAPFGVEKKKLGAGESLMKGAGVLVRNCE